MRPNKEGRVDMNPSATADTQSSSVAPWQSDARVIALVGMAHGASHFGQLLLATLIVFLVRDFGLSYTQIGLLGTVFFVVSGVGQFLSGQWVDRYGARPLLFGALLCMAAACAVAAAAQNYAMLLAAALLAGLGNAPFHPIDYSILNQRVSHARLGHAYSMHSIGGSLGWALAPILLLDVTHLNIAGLGWRMAYIVAFVLFTALIAMLWWQRAALHTHTQPMTKNAKNMSASRRPTEAQPGHTSFALGFMRLPIVWWCFAFFALIALPLSMVQYYAQSIYQTWYGLSVLATGHMLSAYLFMLAVGAVMGGFLLNRLPDHCERVLAGLIALGAVLFGTVALAPIGGSAAIGLLVLTGFVVGVASPSRDMTIKRATPAGATGRVYGVVYSGLDLGMALGPVFFGLLMDMRQYHLVFAVAALLLATSVLVALQIRSLGLRKVAL